jgi:hypothetical protein
VVWQLSGWAGLDGIFFVRRYSFNYRALFRYHVQHNIDPSRASCGGRAEKRLTESVLVQHPAIHLRH